MRKWPPEERAQYIFVNGLADKNGDTSADDDDVQWLVTLALDGIWSSVTEVGPWCPKVLYGMVSMVSQPPGHTPIVCSATFP